MSEQDGSVRRRWVSLDDEQRHLAAELTARAQRIREQSVEGMGWAEAVELAAAQLGLDRRTGV